MKKFLTGLVFFTSFSAFAVMTGDPAPAFDLKNSLGKSVKLSGFKNKVVVLEWLNYGCPFVQKHYESGNMQKIQTDYTKKGVVWLSVISSAPGKEGYSTPEKAEKDRADKKSAATHVLFDTDGKVGKSYGAQTTPHMYVIGKDGKLLYQGAIDDHASTDVEDIPKSKNYVVAALDEVLAGKKVTNPSSKAYGCSVKY